MAAIHYQAILVLQFEIDLASVVSNNSAIFSLFLLDTKERVV